MPVIILTGHGTVDNAVQAMRDGAYDFLTKPVDLERLGMLVKKGIGAQRTYTETQRTSGRNSAS